MKILIITGNPFSRVLNNGKTHEAIFSAFSRDELCELFCRPVETIYTDFNFCSSFYMVTEADIVRKLIFRNKICGNVVKPKNQKYELNTRIYNTSFSSGWTFLKLFRDALWNTGVWKTRNFFKWCITQSPDLIFVDGGGEKFLYNIAIYISDMMNIPIVSFFTDDYFLYNFKKTLIGRYQLKQYRDCLKQLVEKSSACFAIGKYMADDYSKYFNKPFLHIMNCTDVPLVRNKQLHKITTISYFGGLQLERWKMIVKLAKIVGKRYVINVYSFSKLTLRINREFHEVGINYYNGLVGDALFNCMNNSDVLLHVESDKKRYRTFTRLAISTKIPEYLMTGKVVLGFGPLEIASMRILSDNHIGIVISSEADQDKIERLMYETLSDDKHMSLVAQNGQEFAIRNFNKKTNSLYLRREIALIIKMHNYEFSKI